MENSEEFEFEPIDYSDVCDVVQRLRHISFGAALNLNMPTIQDESTVH